MTRSASLELSTAALRSSNDKKQLGLIFSILLVASFLLASNYEVQAKIHQDVVLGGVNLTPWCQKQYGSGFIAKLIGKTAGDWTCERSAGDRRPVLVNKACILQYGPKAYKAKALKRNDPYSWKCLGKRAIPTPPSTNASTAICEPGPLEVAFFQHKSYKGKCSVLPIGMYGNSRALRMRNDSISSIKIGSRVNVTVCKHAANSVASASFFKKNPQRCQTFKGTDAADDRVIEPWNLEFKRIGNDSISSAWIFRPTTENKPTQGACKPAPNTAEVAVYQFANYKGNCRILSLGDYRNPNEMRFKNDSISSIEFGDFSKATINIYQHSGFRGRRENKLVASLPQLRTSQVGDNQISSIRVKRK